LIGGEDLEKTKSSRRRNLRLVITIMVIGFVLLWFSDFLPQRVAEVVASGYMSKQEDGNDCYMVYFEDESGARQRNIGIYWRYFPFNVYFDSDYPG
jgi:hypothetical protein